jgi:MSHA biogenesis protein MshP
MNRRCYGKERHNVRGFSLVAAIFILVVLAAIGAFMVTIGYVAQATATGAVRGARAFQAAQAGIEWGVARAVPPAGPLSCLGSSSFTLAVPGLDGFAVTVTCAQTTYQERGTPYQVFSITSTATAGSFGDPAYVSRTLTASVTNAS